MIRISAITATCLAVLAGAQAQTSTVNMQFGGKARSYILHLPTGGGTNLPLMFILHGFGMTAADQQSSVKMDGIADREKFIVAYPNAIDKNWDQTGDSDWKFILAVLDSIDGRSHIDKNRVYLAGFSQGAGMTHAGGCRYAPVPGNIPADCKPVRTLPMFLTFGTKDIATPEKFMQSASTWAMLNECPATPTVTRPYPATNPNSVMTRITWSGCKNGTEVIADSSHGGPHEWPMDTQTKVNNSEEVWAFFKKFSLSGTTDISRLPAGAGAGAAPGGMAAVYVDGGVRLQGVGDGAKVRVLDIRGKVVAATTAGEGGFEFKGKPSGVYQVLIDRNGQSTSFRMVVP